MTRNDGENPYAAPQTPLAPGRRASAKVLMALLASLAITSALGFTFLFNYWSTRRLVALAWARSLGFVVIMAGVHIAGYMAYRRQREGIDP